MQYSLKVVTPCADYDGFTIEGDFIAEIVAEKFLDTVKAVFENVINLSDGDIIISQSSDYEIYIYEFKHFIISKTKTVLDAINLMDKLFDYYLGEKNEKIY